LRTLESSKITDQIIRDREVAINQKQGEYDATKRDLSVLNKDIFELAEEVEALKNDINVIRQDNAELKQIIDETIEKNRDLLAYKDKLEEKIGSNEFNIERTLKDIEVLKLDDRDIRADYSALVLEKEALERHAKILINQNDELTRELEMFVQTDEVLRSQLDRKARLNDLSYKISSDNERGRAKIDYVRSISRSRSPVYERSRSPVYERSRSPPVYERVVYDKK
jgi:chromosome segregation ATPase